jgi:hypothetical protein
VVVFRLPEGNGFEACLKQLFINYFLILKKKVPKEDK